MVTCTKATIALFYEFSTQGVIKEHVMSPKRSNSFHAFLNTETGKVTFHKGYLPDIEWRAHNNVVAYPYQNKTNNLLVGLNVGNRSYGKQWFWEHRMFGGGENLIPQGYTMVDLRKNEIPSQIRRLVDAHNSTGNEELVVNAVAKKEFVVRTPPVTLPKINW